MPAFLGKVVERLCASRPAYAARSLVTVGSRLIRALQSLIGSRSIPVVRAAAWSRLSRMSSSAACFHGWTDACLARSYASARASGLAALKSGTRNVARSACENDGFVSIVPRLIRKPSAPRVELHHAQSAFASSRLVVRRWTGTHIDPTDGLSLNIARRRPESVLNFAARRTCPA